MKKSDLKKLIAEELIAVLREQEVLDRALGPTSGQLEPQLPSTEAPGNDVEKLKRVLRASLKKQSELAAEINKNSRTIKALANALQELTKAVELAGGLEQKQSNSTYANNNR